MPLLKSILKPILGSILQSVLGSVNKILTYSPLTTSYTSATFTPVVVTNTEIISLHVKNLSTSATNQYFFRGTTSSIYYRGSDGRFRVTDDIGGIRTINYTGLNDGGAYYVEIRIDSGGWDLYVDGIYINRANGAMSNITISSLANTMDVGTIYGVTLGGSSSWPMQSTEDDVFDSEDMIGSNDLTYVGAPVPTTSTDTVETTPL